MTLDLAQFHDAFFQESFEALDSMEAALLQLSAGDAEPEAIHTIFRVAHSIKGGSATFGFMEIASFTHTAETLLDQLRSNQLQVTANIVDLLLKSVDVMRDMLTATKVKKPIDGESVKSLQRSLETAIAGEQLGTQPAPEADASGSGVASESAAAAAEGTQMAGWRIRFRPGESLLRNGNDPVLLLRELAARAPITVRVDAAALPPLAELDPEICRLRWEIDVPPEVTREQIAEVFDWAEADCELIVESLGAPVAEASPPQTAASASPVAAVPAAPATAETAAQSASDAAASTRAADASSIRVSIEKIDELMNTVGELVITQSMLSQLSVQLEGPASSDLRSGLGQLERQMRALQESVMRVRMLPISFVFNRFPRMVRDMSQKLGKHVELKMTGADTEIDKTVLEKIGDPLVHLVRNSIDHGLEAPAARVAAGKSDVGTIHLNAYHRGGNIIVEVSDDGTGLDAEKILRKARERGLVGSDEELSEERIQNLIFAPGFSTAEQVTDLSGRGVGMDVVRRNVKALGGKIDVKSERGHGSRFTITLPLTLAIVDGQSVAVGTETYIVPLISIVESLQLKPGDVNRVFGRGEVFPFRGDYLPVIRLHELFGVQPRARALHEGLIVVAEGDGSRVGLFVDDLLGQQQAVIKSLETNYGHIEGVSGATILGDGSVALILDLSGLVRAASMRAAA